jgi:hypothetical protein
LDEPVETGNFNAIACFSFIVAGIYNDSPAQPGETGDGAQAQQEEGTLRNWRGGVETSASVFLEK